MNYVYLAAAILFEVAATSALRASDGMTRIAPTILCLIGYAAAFYLLSLTLRTVPVGVAYAIWSGVGIVLIAVIGTFWFRQPIDFAAILGMVLIVAGVGVIALFSKTAGH
ncbi:MAG: multidrug efflux SMR transporter [Bauldia sp.]|nr:multidrug efflux SMR transporter [Bauldia sp.]